MADKQNLPYSGVGGLLKVEKEQLGIDKATGEGRSHAGSGEKEARDLGAQQHYPVGIDGKAPVKSLSAGVPGGERPIQGTSGSSSGSSSGVSQQRDESG